MIKSNAERQKEFRQRRANGYKKLEILLPDNAFKLLHGNAKELGLTKASYVISLLQGNEIKTVLAPKSQQKDESKPSQETVKEVLNRFLPIGINSTNDTRSALSDGYRKAIGIKGLLKPKDLYGLTYYLQSLSADEITQLIQIKRDDIRAKANKKKCTIKKY